MIALIDADIIAYRCAASAENEPLYIAQERADALIERIMFETGAGSSKLFLTGSGNFRHDINPEYKANRKDKPKPRWLQELREHLVMGWAATISEGNEADDELGIAQCTTTGGTVICSIDKDLLMIPGNHYNFVKNEHKTVSSLEGQKMFYYQLIMGDTSDNIFGFDGKARSKVPKFLEPRIDYLLSLDNQYDMFEYTLNLYGGSVDEPLLEVYEINAHCLYIWQKQNDKWQPPTKPLDSVQD